MVKSDDPRVQADRPDDSTGAVGNQSLSSPGSGFGATDSAAGATAASSSGNTEEELRHSLLQFFICYAPERIMEVPMWLHRFPHATKAIDVKLKMKRDFGQEPVENEALLCLQNDIRTRLYVFYAHYSPDKLSEVDRLVHKFHGRDAELMEAVERKYGPEQPVHDLFNDWQSRDPQTGLLKKMKEEQAQAPSLAANPAFGQKKGAAMTPDEADIAQKLEMNNTNHGQTPVGVPRNQAAQQAEFPPGEDPKDVTGLKSAGRRVSFADQGRKASNDITSPILPPKKGGAAVTGSNNNTPARSTGTDVTMTNSANRTLSGSQGSDSDGPGADSFMQRQTSYDPSLRKPGASGDDVFGDIPWAASVRFDEDSDLKRDPSFTSQQQRPRRANDDVEELDLDLVDPRPKKPQPPPGTTGVHLQQTDQAKTVVPVENDHSMHASYHQLLSAVGIQREAVKPALKSTTIKAKPAQLVYHNSDEDFSPPSHLLQDTSLSHTPAHIGSPIRADPDFNNSSNFPLGGGGAGGRDDELWSPLVIGGGGGFSGASPNASKISHLPGDQDHSALRSRSFDLDFTPSDPGPKPGSKSLGEGGPPMDALEYAKVLKKAGLDPNRSEIVGSSSSPAGKKAGKGKVLTDSRHRKLDFITMDDFDKL